MFKILILYMEKIELEIKQDENTITDFAEKLELVSILIQKKNFYRNSLLNI